MPRKHRLEFPGACFHVLNRGNYRRDLFTFPGSAEAFERTLFEACASFEWQLHAFVIMSNHFHLAIELFAPTLSVGMKWLQGTWALRFNRFHEQVGRPFQGRFKAIHVEPGPSFGQVAHYIHLNPVRAHLVPPGQAGTFRFSSLWHFQQQKRPPCLVATTALASAGRLPDSSDGWLAYCSFLETIATAETAERRELYSRIRRSWCLGSDAFSEQLRTRLAPDGEKRARSPGSFNAAAWNTEREKLWEIKLQEAAQAAGVDLECLPKKKSAPIKVALAAHMKATTRRTAASNIWLAARLAMGKPDSVSQYVARQRKGAANALFRSDFRLSGFGI
jgi:putative transposase